MAPQIVVFVIILPIVALLTFLLGHMIASHKKRPSMSNGNALLKEYEINLRKLNEEKIALKQQLNESIKAQSESYHAYLDANSKYMHSREYIENLLSYDTTLAQNFARMQYDYTRMYNERAALLKKIKQTSALSLPTPQDYQKTKEELSCSRTNLLKQQQENESLRKTHDKLSEEKKRILEKLQKVYNAYKSISSKATKLQQKAKITDTIRLEKDKLHSLYTETVEKLKHHEKKTESMRKLENEKNELALKIEVLQAQIAEMESIREENKILFEQNKKIEVLQRNLSMMESENAVLRAKNLVIDKPQN